MAPPLSITGVWQSLRWPTANDLVFSLKAYLAVILCLIVGFSQNLLNPYWSALTVYIVLLPPASGALRSKALYRLIGTVAGGLSVMATTAIAAGQVGVMLVLNIAIVAIATWANEIDRTPASYIWFSGGLTTGFIGLIDLQQPGQMFTLATARMAEICVGILGIAAVDSLIAPVPMKPKFLKMMGEWHDSARDWIVDALGTINAGPPTEKRRGMVHDNLRKLTGTIGALDAMAVQLPYDIVAAPPRRCDVHLVRRMVMRVATDLAAIEEWIHAARVTPSGGEAQSGLIASVSDWVCERDGEDDTLFVDIGKGEQLRARVAAADKELGARRDHEALVQNGILRRLDGFIENWIDLAIAMRSVATRARLPHRLRPVAAAAKPVRSIDYLVAAFDVAPLLLATSVAATSYYLTAWASGTNAMLFAFIGCVFLIGQPSTLRSGLGVVSWVGVAFVLVFAYQFAILPRVTAFPVLVAVFAAILIPVGLFMSMTQAGLFIGVFFFALLSLQGTYTGNFERSLLSLGGSMAGLIFAVFSMYVLSYNRPRVTARRLVRAVRLDIYNAACSVRRPSSERFLLLTVDRLSQFIPAIDKLGEDDPLAKADLIDDLRVGLNILALREMSPELPASLRGGIDRLLASIGSAFRRHASGEDLPGDLQRQIDALIGAPGGGQNGDVRRRLLAALFGLRLGLAPDASPYVDEAEDEGEDAPAADADEHEDAEEPGQQ